MELARRDKLIQLYKDEIERQKNSLHQRYDEIKHSRNPFLQDVKEDYKMHFSTIDHDASAHIRQLNAILSHLDQVMKEDAQQMDLKREKRFTLQKKHEFEELKKSLEKILH